MGSTPSDLLLKRRANCCNFHAEKFALLSSKKKNPYDAVKFKHWLIGKVLTILDCPFLSHTVVNFRSRARRFGKARARYSRTVTVRFVIRIVNR